MPGPRRFFGVITLDATRPGPQITQIAQAIVAELSRVGGTKVTLKLDIDAEAPADFPPDVVDVVNANAKTLKFRTVRARRTDRQSACGHRRAQSYRGGRFSRSVQVRVGGNSQ